MSYPVTGLVRTITVFILGVPILRIFMVLIFYCEFDKP